MPARKERGCLTADVVVKSLQCHEMRGPFSTTVCLFVACAFAGAAGVPVLPSVEDAAQSRLRNITWPCNRVNRKQTLLFCIAGSQQSPSKFFADVPVNFRAYAIEVSGDRFEALRWRLPGIFRCKSNVGCKSIEHLDYSALSPKTLSPLSAVAGRPASDCTEQLRQIFAQKYAPKNATNSEYRASEIAQLFCVAHALMTAYQNAHMLSSLNRRGQYKQAGYSRNASMGFTVAKHRIRAPPQPHNGSHYVICIPRFATPRRISSAPAVAVWNLDCIQESSSLTTDIATSGSAKRNCRPPCRVTVTRNPDLSVRRVVSGDSGAPIIPENPQPPNRKSDGNAGQPSSELVKEIIREAQMRTEDEFDELIETLKQERRWENNM